eukprot:g200.t1
MGVVTRRVLLLSCLVVRTSGWVQLECNSSVTVCTRVKELLQRTNVSEARVLLSVGETASTGRIFNDTDRARLEALGSEGFILKSAALAAEYIGVGVLGNAWAGAPPALGNISANGGSGGVVFGAYAALARLGFGFLHPLQPSLPPAGRAPPTTALLPLGVLEASAPQWPERGFSHHTQHTVELMYTLNGVGSVPLGAYADEGAFATGLPMVARWAEWLAARRQNRAQWILLDLPGARNGGGGLAPGANFTWSPLRQGRLARLVRIFHGYGVSVGVDVPLVFTQENSMNLARPGAGAPVAVQIAASTDWLLDAGFDFVASESGFSEFTHGSDAQMLEYMNEAAQHLRGSAKRRADFYMKVHVSSGQHCTNFSDPRTGEPLNFNFLPMLADPAVGVYPHTVQFYGLRDPVANSYGQANFTFMEDWMFYIARQQQPSASASAPASATPAPRARRRKIVFKPETAYWGNFDNTVPLFLPLYALKRVDDLQRIARRERGEGVKLDGQVVFSSGWEWGYWLSDVVAADAAWRPHEDADAASATASIVADALAPLLPQRDTTAVGAWVARVAALQNSTLIYGESRPGHRPACSGRGGAAAPPAKLTGIAYLEGWDAISDLERLSADIAGQAVPNTQPSKLDFGAVRLLGPLLYDCTLRPLLRAMSDGFAAELAAAPRLAAPEPLLAELVDALNATATRAAFVLRVNDAAAAPNGSAAAAQGLVDARAMISRVADIVSRRESLYRVPAAQLGGWGKNPTSYNFGYLWDVKSQYYYWRDYYKAAAEHPSAVPWALPPHAKSPCFLNVQDPVSTQFGGGALLTLAHFIHKYLEKHQHDPFGLADCLSFPGTEPTFPMHNESTRPDRH